MKKALLILGVVFALCVVAVLAHAQEPLPFNVGDRVTVDIAVMFAYSLNADGSVREYALVPPGIPATFLGPDYDSGNVLVLFERAVLASSNEDVFLLEGGVPLLASVPPDYLRPYVIACELPVPAPTLARPAVVRWAILDGPTGRVKRASAPTDAPCQRFFCDDERTFDYGGAVLSR